MKVWLFVWCGVVPLAAGLMGCRGSHPSEGAKISRPALQTQSALVPASAARQQKPPAQGAALILHRWVEPKEGALTLLLPPGWIGEGGVVRVDPRLGPTNSVAAKIDVAVKKDAAGSTMIHWYANYTYKDPRFVPGFAIGRNYMGSMVYPTQSPESFLTQFILRRQRPQARNVQILERKPLPDLVRQYKQRFTMPNMQFDGISLSVAYDENGAHYREEMVAVIENVASLGMWTNHNTMSVRAPAAEFIQDQPLFETIIGSLRNNSQWVAAENRGADVRAQNALATQRYLQEQRHQMVERQREVNAEARHSSWLFLTGQDDYVNPHTGEVEQGSNEYKYRWVNSSGDVIYSNNPDYDPTHDTSFQGRMDFKLSPLRQR